MSGRLAGKICLVTGAAQGIGKATVARFIKEGGKVIAVDIDAEKLKEWDGKQGILMTRVLDVSDGAGVRALAKEVGLIHVLFNCAGFVFGGTILETTDDDWDLSFNINVKSMFFFIQAFLPKMLENGGGSIINMASCASHLRGIPKRCVYGATKAAVVGLTKSVAKDYIKQGIRCNAVCPSVVATENFLSRAANQSDSDKDIVTFVEKELVGRLQTPEEVANLCLYLASDEASYHTGNVLLMDGGLTL